MSPIGRGGVTLSMNYCQGKGLTLGYFITNSAENGNKIHFYICMQIHSKREISRILLFEIIKLFF